VKIAHDECIMNYKFSCTSTVEPTPTPTPTPTYTDTYPHKTPKSEVKKIETSGTTVSPSTPPYTGGDGNDLISSATAIQVSILSVLGLLALLLI